MWFFSFKLFKQFTKERCFLNKVSIKPILLEGFLSFKFCKATFLAEKYLLSKNLLVYAVFLNSGFCSVC